MSRPRGWRRRAERGRRGTTGCSVTPVAPAVGAGAVTPSRQYLDISWTKLLRSAASTTRKERPMRKLLLVLTGVAALAVPTAASARPPAATPSIVETAVSVNSSDAYAGTF